MYPAFTNCKMEEKIIFKTYNSFEADQILASFQDAGIPAYKREHGIGQLVEIAAGMSRTSLIEIIIPEEAEDAADEILINMGLLAPPPGTGAAIDSKTWADDTPQGKAALLDDFAMYYETAVLYLKEENYLEEFYQFFFFKNREQTLIPFEESFQDAFTELCGDRGGKSIADKTESLFGRPKRMMVFESVDTVKEELEASSDGWGPFYVVFDLMFCEYDGFTLCFICGSNN